MAYIEEAELEFQIGVVEESIEKYERRVPTEEQDPEYLRKAYDELNRLKSRMKEIKKLKKQ